jgi:hypothetical protein
MLSTLSWLVVAAAQLQLAPVVVAAAPVATEQPPVSRLLQA